jgi:hypothetical protein
MDHGAPEAASGNQGDAPPVAAKALIAYVACWSDRGVAESWRVVCQGFRIVGAQHPRA